jgi:hypothetical protein
MRTMAMLLVLVETHTSPSTVLSARTESDIRICFSCSFRNQNKKEALDIQLLILHFPPMENCSPVTSLNRCAPNGLQSIRSRLRFPSASTAVPLISVSLQSPKHQRCVFFLLKKWFGILHELVFHFSRFGLCRCLC